MHEKIINVKGKINTISLASTETSKIITLKDGKKFYTSLNEQFSVGDMIEAELTHKKVSPNGKKIMFADKIQKITQ
jgi:ribosomal protein S4E